MLRRSALFLAAIFVAATANAQVYKDSNATVDARVKDLLSRMTLEEKVGQMSMSSLKGSMNNPLAYGVCESPFVTINEIASLSIASYPRALQIGKHNASLSIL